MDIHQLVGDPVAASVFAALKEAKWRKARDLAKDLCKKDRARYLPLLIEANVGLAKDLQARGLQTDAEQVLAYLKSICPPEMWLSLKAELEKAQPAVPATSSINTLNEPAVSSPKVLMAMSWPVVLKTAEACEKGLPITAEEWAVVDVAVSTFTPAQAGEKGSLGERVVAELEIIHQACAATAEGRWEEAQTGLRALARQSVFQHWRMFLRGVRHHFQRELGQAQRCFATLPPGNALVRAACIIAGREAVPGTARTAPSRAKAEWWLAVSGEQRMLATALIEAQMAWLMPDVKLAYEILSKAFGKDFPSLKSDLAGLMTHVIMPLRAPCGEFEEKRSQQWSKLYHSLACNVKSETLFYCTAVRALDLRDAPLMTANDLFQEWQRVLHAYTKLLGPSPMRDSIGWLWLGEQMMKKPQALSFFSRSEMKHRHGEHARTALLKAVACDPTHEAAALMLLRFHEESKDTSARNKLLDELVKIFPENKNVLTQASMRAAERKSFTKALSSLRKVRKIDPLDRKAQSALVGVLIMQARELTKKKQPVDAVWAEIDSFANNAPGPFYHTHAHWTLRMRRAILASSDTLTAEAVALAPSAIEALFFERLVAPLYKCVLRASWQQTWKQALLSTPGWRALPPIVAASRYCSQMEGFGLQEVAYMRIMFNEVLDSTAKQHLTTDATGLIHFIRATSSHDWADAEYLWIGTLILGLRGQLRGLLTPYVKSTDSDPRLRFSALLLETDHFDFIMDSDVKQRLADIMSSAKMQGIPELVKAAEMFKTEHQKYIVKEGQDDTFYEGAEDSAQTMPAGPEYVTEEDIASVQPHLLTLILELGDAVTAGDLAAIKRIKAKAVAGGMSGALFDKFARLPPSANFQKEKSSGNK